MKEFHLLYYVYFFILKILNIQSLQFLKAIHMTDNNYYYMITADNLYYYTDGKKVNQKTLTTFINDQIITTYKESEMIDLSIFEEATNAQILFVKHYFYGLYNKKYYCNTPIDELKGYYSEVFTIKYTLKYSYLVLGMIDYTTKKLQLFLIQNQTVDCKITIVFNIGINNVDSNNINCQLMQSSSNGQVLTCFYQSSNEIIASSFNIIIDSPKIELITSLTKPKINDGAKIIKSILSQDEKRAFVCYINNDNNCYCLTYNIINNEWSDYNIYLSNCVLNISSLNIDYSENKNEYVVYCFQSTTKFNIQKLDENFEKKEDEENGYYDLMNQLNTCSEYYLSSLEYESDNINMFVICDNNIKKYEIKHSKITNLLSTTILTTLPETTTLKLLSDRTFLLPLSTSIIHSTLLLISSSIIHNFQDYSIIIQKETNISKEYIINNIDNITTALNDYNISKIYEIFGKDYNIKISPIHLKMYKNITTSIDFSNCENILRQKNRLSESSVLILYQIEINNPNQQSLFNYVEYAVFNENREILDLSVCENEFIDIKYQINTSMINKTKVKYYADLGIDIFNINDNFFNDICYPYYEDDSDLILKDRVTDIYENYSLCENNCNYNKINLTDYTVSCKCSIKKEVSREYPPPKLAKIIIDSFKDSNVGVIKCYNLVFGLKNKLKNIGFWIFTILVFLHVPFFISYFIYNISSIRKYIYIEMEKYHYCYQKINPIKKTIKDYKTKNSHKKSNMSKNVFHEELRDCDTKSINRKLLNINDNINNDINLKKLKPSQRLLNKKTRKTLSTKEIKNNNIQRPIIFFNYKINNCINNNFKSENNIKENNILKNKNKNKILSPNYYSLIQIDANNASNTKPINSYIILDIYDYKTALKYDKRNYWRLVYICILAKENIINILFFKTPLDIQSLRACLFLFTYSCDLAFNTIFFTNENISDKYHYHGNNLFLFSMVNNLLQTIISTVVGLILVNIFQLMIDSRGNFEDIFRKEEKKMRKNKNYKVKIETKYKIIEKIKKISSKLKCYIRIFIIIEFIIMIFFYYFVTAFCEVYNKTQNAWLYDFFISFLISLSSEIIGSCIIASFYILSIRYKIKFIYNIALFLYNL